MKPLAKHPIFPISIVISLFQRAKRGFLWFVCLMALTVAQSGRGQLVMPDFAVVGKKGGEIGKLWSTNATDHLFPQQIAVDFNGQGIVYGFVCEYRWSPDVFQEITGKIEKSGNPEQKARRGGYFAWRDENRKLAISLFRDQESDTIKLIVVSTDASIRGKSAVKTDKNAK